MVMAPAARADCSLAAPSCVIDTVEEVVDPATEITDPVLEEVTEVTDPVVGTVGGLVDNVVEETVGPIIDEVEEHRCPAHPSKSSSLPPPASHPLTPRRNGWMLGVAASSGERSRYPLWLGAPSCRTSS